MSYSDLIKRKRQGIADKKTGHKKAYKFKTGTTTIRILPGWRKDKEDLTFSHSFGQSWIKDMDGKVMAAVGDASITYGQDDPIRNLIERAIGEARFDTQRAHYKDMKAKPRELVNALVLDDKEIDPNEPQIVDFSESQFDTIMSQVEMAGIEDEFLDLENGFDLKVNKTGRTMQDTKYSFTFARKSRPVDPAVMENVIDLDAWIRSQFSDRDKAVNALKSLTAGAEVLSIPDRSASYAGDENVVDGSFTDITQDASTVRDPVHSIATTDADIDALFGNDDDVPF